MLITSVVVAVLAYLAWLPVARARWLTSAVLVVLIVLAVGTVALAAWQPRAAVEAHVLLFLGTAVVLLVARSVQRRRLREGGEAEKPAAWPWPWRLAVGSALFIACCCLPAAAWDGNDDGYLPSVADLGPLPDDITVPDAAGDTECGFGGCAVGYRLVCRPGERSDEVVRRMWDHLTEQGWPPPENGRSCRPIGWLLDTRETCVLTGTSEGQAELTLTGGRPLHPA
ncbi:hypothetical protein ACL02O_22130 [Micromonospora sp. MS34]|uniref:hypothetical protein n=1 Tax=Micromonospora sp. MS34 TaxID=3385971 RepID=UPI0039A00FA2